MIAKRNPPGRPDDADAYCPTPTEVAAAAAKIKAANLEAMGALPWDGYGTCGEQAPGVRQYVSEGHSGRKIFRSV